MQLQFHLLFAFVGVEDLLCRGSDMVCQKGI